LFVCDDHGGEAVVGRRDAYWARGRSAVTNSLLLSAVGVVEAVFADRNASALGGILNQQGVGNLTGGRCYWYITTDISCYYRIVYGIVKLRYTMYYYSGLRPKQGYRSPGTKQNVCRKYHVRK
jgi:hypothetical protein